MLCETAMRRCGRPAADEPSVDRAFCIRHHLVVDADSSSMGAAGLLNAAVRLMDLS